MCILKLIDMQEGAKKEVNYTALIKAKYPAVSIWIENMERVSLVRKYQIEFMNDYIGAMQESWNINTFK